MIDGRPSRMQQAGDRRAQQRPDALRRPHDELSQPEAVPRQAVAQRDEPASSRGSHQPGLKSWLIRLAIVVAIVTAASLLVWLIWSQNDAISDKIDKDKHQAVFLTSGQVYFGKLEVIDRNWFRLSDVYYVQNNIQGDSDELADAEKPTDSTTKNMQLIKLGDEVHGPEDEMLINRDQVTILENLKPGSRVSQLIQSTKSGKR